jgi:choline-sulfatase
MVRSGTWKLVYSHGYAAQLYDLARDPHERNDLAADPAHAEVRDRLLARVLEGWDPERIAHRIGERRREKAILEAWARAVQPPDEFRWQLLPEHNRLEAAEQ